MKKILPVVQFSFSFLVGFFLFCVLAFGFSFSSLELIGLSLVFYRAFCFLSCKKRCSKDP